MYRVNRLTYPELIQFAESELYLDKKYKRPSDEDRLLGPFHNLEINSDLTIFGLFYDKKLIGYAVVNKSEDFIHSFYIAKSHRNKGHGLRFLFRLKYNNVHVRRANKKAVRLYERFGMHEDIDNSDHVLMHMVKIKENGDGRRSFTEDVIGRSARLHDELAS